MEMPIHNADKLLNMWSARYFSIRSYKSVSFHALNHSASSSGRQRTVERLQTDLVEKSCKQAAIRAKDLYMHHENLTLQKTAELAHLGTQIYPVLLEFYQGHEPTIVINQSGHGFGDQSSLSVFAIPEIHALGNLIEPLLSKFKSPDIKATNWQARSFLTTELNLSGQLLLECLSPEEQMLLGPYIAFIEEYVAIPWQRLCAAATEYSSKSPSLRLVERMFPKVSEISIAVYTQGCKSFGGYYNRRGQLNTPAVKHSSLRDLDMFQAYLWLCVLQGNLEAIEQELLVLCDLVYRGIGAPWEMAFQAAVLLSAEIMKNLEFADQLLLEPYSSGLIRAFAAGR